MQMVSGFLRGRDFMRGSLVSARTSLCPGSRLQPFKTDIAGQANLSHSSWRQVSWILAPSICDIESVHSLHATLCATLNQNHRHDRGTLNVCATPVRGECVMPVNEIAKNQSIARTCAAVDRVRLSRAATRHAIERSRKSLHETQALLAALRRIYCRRL